jgi:hypothetical protein
MAIADNTSQQQLMEQLKEKGFSLDPNIQTLIEKLSTGLDFSPDGLKALGNVDTAKSDLSAAVAQDIEFTVNEWGLVLIIREPAVKYLQGGGTITAATLAEIAAAAGVVIPVAGVAIGVVCGIFAFVISAYLGIITMVDEGKGIYLTESWGQIVAAILFPAFAGTILLPVVGPIK